MKDISKLLQNIEKQIKQVLEGEVSSSELFTEEFMRNNTDFTTFDEFITKSPASGMNLNELDEWPVGFDDFVKQRTEFQNWEEFKTAAGNVYAKAKLRENGIHVE